MTDFNEDTPLDEFDSNIADEYSTQMDYEETFEETETLDDLEEPEIESGMVDVFYRFKKGVGWVGDRSALLIHNAKMVRDPITKEIYVDYNNKKIRINSKKKST